MFDPNRDALCCKQGMRVADQGLLARPTGLAELQSSLPAFHRVFHILAINRACAAINVCNMFLY